MATIRSFRDLRVLQAAFRAAALIFEYTKGWPVEERYALTGQVRRSSRSVCGCIVEAWRKRRYPAAFVAKLNDAEAEAAETRLWLDFALKCGYLKAADHARLDATYERIIGQLVRMIETADRWAVGRPSNEARRQHKGAPDTNVPPEPGRAPHPQSPSQASTLNADSSPESGRAPTPQSPSQGPTPDKESPRDPSATGPDPQSGGPANNPAHPANPAQR